MRNAILSALSMTLTLPLFAASGINVTKNSSVVSLYLEGGKFQFVPGETFTAKTTVLGNYVYSRALIVPATLAHGDWKLAQEQSLDHRYLSDGGVVSFRAPSKEGSYEIRVFTGYSPALQGAVIPISVKGGAVQGSASHHAIAQIALVMSRSWIVPGETMTVNYTLPSKDVDGAWIGIFPAGSSDGKVHSRSYLYKTGSNSVTLKAPTQPDQYLIKLFRSADSDPLASFDFKVSK